MKIVCDTNVLVSATLSDGTPRKLLRLIACGEVENAVSLEILAEAKNVWVRPKFGLSPEQVTQAIDVFSEISLLVAPVQPVDVIKDDPSDNRILEAADAAKADCIVSGDKHLLNLQSWNGIEILSPASFLERLNG
ncbi:MAG: putative toxin-antitoxin system toxin component, PIN family [Kiritimatiellales bacterium]|nr:putative toxin-antitoxin system toxin component, PIN family [Kiritimatiellales bacterium]MCF7863357.1 putative toxin-antitoxin system toxin component, PIN family [Kiritimatiellales bacterium]